MRDCVPVKVVRDAYFAGLESPMLAETGCPEVILRIFHAVLMIGQGFRIVEDGSNRYIGERDGFPLNFWDGGGKHLAIVCPGDLSGRPDVREIKKRQECVLAWFYDLLRFVFCQDHLVMRLHRKETSRDYYLSANRLLEDTEPEAVKHALWIAFGRYAEANGHGEGFVDQVFDCAAALERGCPTKASGERPSRVLEFHWPMSYQAGQL